MFRGCIDRSHEDLQLINEREEAKAIQPAKGRAKQQASKPKRQRTNNRKHSSKKHTYTFEGAYYEVDARCEGLYTDILNKELELLFMALELWGKVLVVRFDLHHTGLYFETSKHISDSIVNLLKRIKRKYKHKALYLWIRELGIVNEGQHYHFVLFLNAKKPVTAKQTHDLAEETWKHQDNSRSIWRCETNYKLNPQDENYREKLNNAIFAISYLAKVSQKGYRPKQAKDYNHSQIRRVK